MRLLPTAARTLLLTAVLILGAACGQENVPPDAEGPVVAAGDSLASAPLYPASRDVAAPPFTLPSLSGEPFSLEAHRGRVVVLNLWATWCGPCRVEIPDFIALQRELGDRGLVFVGVSLDDEGEEAVRDFAEALAINYPVVIDDGRVEEAYGPTEVLPTTFVIDQKGTLRFYAPGMLTEAALRPVLLDLLEEQETGA
jgi:thiol-disulfide isomerase/thioredoxin